MTKHFVSVAGVITNNINEVLLIQRVDNGEWQIPGGILELDEFLLEGLAREVFEETGIEVDVEFLSGVYKNTTLKSVALVFKCVFTKGELRTSLETKQVIWKKIEDLENLMNPTFYVRVTDAINSSKVAKIRNHNGTIMFD